MDNIGVNLWSCPLPRRRLIRCLALSSLVVPSVLALVLLSSVQFDENLSPNRVSSSSPVAKERRVFAYIKVFKTGSQTLVSIFRRFGLSRRSIFALPLPNKIFLGWPWQPRPEFVVLPWRASRAEILVDHCVYNRSFLKSLMQPNSIYLASVRSPFYQVQSVFQYYRVGEIAGLDQTAESFELYMKRADHYDAVYSSPNRSSTRYCVPDNFSMTRNPMSTVLGFREGEDPENFVERVVNEFDLVMVSDHFVESLILLRRLMGWTFKDILYEDQNTLRYRRFSALERPDLADLHRRRSPADHRLFSVANATLWRRIQSEGVDFNEEILEFRSILNSVRRHCRRRLVSSNGTKPESGSPNEFRWQATRWSPEFVVTDADCRQLGSDNIKDLLLLSQKEFKGDLKWAASQKFC